MHLQAKALEELLEAKNVPPALPSKMEESISYNNKSTQTYELQKDLSLLQTESARRPLKQAEKAAVHVSFNPKDSELNKGLTDSKLSRRADGDRTKAKEDSGNSPGVLLNIFESRGNQSQRKEFSTFCTRRSEALIVNHPLLYNSDKDGPDNLAEGKETRRTRINDRNLGINLPPAKLTETQGMPIGRKAHSKSRDDLVIRPMLELKTPLTPKTQNRGLFGKAADQRKLDSRGRAMGKLDRGSDDHFLEAYTPFRHDASPALTDTQKLKADRSKAEKGLGNFLEGNRGGKVKTRPSGLNESLLYSMHQKSNSNVSNYRPNGSMSEESESRRLRRDVPCVDSNLRKVKRVVVERDTVGRSIDNLSEKDGHGVAWGDIEVQHLRQTVHADRPRRGGQGAEHEVRRASRGQNHVRAEQDDTGRSVGGGAVPPAAAGRQRVAFC